MPVPVPASRPRTLTVKAIKPITIQHRTLWHWHSRQPRQPHISWMRIDRKIRPFPNPSQSQSQSQPQNKIKNKKNTEPDTWTWGTGLKPGFGSVFGSMEWFEKEHQRAQRRMEAIKREIENDPYGVLFGRPGSGRIGQSGMGMGQLWKDLFGDGHGDSHSAGTSTTTGADGKSSLPEKRPAQAKPRQPTTTTTTTSDQIVGEKLDRADLEFDPVAGRMVQKIQAKDRGDFDPVTGRMTPKGYLSPIEREPSSEASVQEPEPQKMNAKILGQEQDTKIVQPVQESKIVQEETKVPEQEAKIVQETKVPEQESKIVQPVHPVQEQEGKLKIQDSTQQAEPILLPEDQELDLLRASDIRASYQTTPTQIQQSLSSIEERVSGLAEDTALLEAEVQDAKAAKLDTKATETEAEVQSAKEIKQGTGHTYCVLAYDPSTQQVTRANTVSSLASTSTSTSTPEYEYETCHPKDILPRLNHPAKFVGYFEQMHKDGYEIVSGGGDVLVFRSPSPSPSGQSKTEKPQQDANTKTGADTGAGAGAGPLRRMAFAGTATAATCYAIGVVTEYFRTGGVDGRGMDGFTAFESERKAIAYGA